MRLLILYLGIISAIILSACTGSAIEFERTPTLSEPSVRIVQATETSTNNLSILATETTELNSDSISANLNPDMVFGIESHEMDFQNYDEIVGDSGFHLVRHNGLVWQNVEPNEGDRQWEAVDNLEDKLANASASGLSTILIVRGTPAWAQQVPGSACGPIKADKIKSFADFMMEAVLRYSVPPYNVKYWELGNEPDVDPSLVHANSVFGCWGDQFDPYYGGGYYAEMLKSVYPAIKSVDSEAKVIIGGLLLDCDPTHPPEGKDCTPGKYLEGILMNGGGEYFDMLSFHGYTPYFGPTSGAPNALFFDEQNSSWEHRGGVVIGKVDFLRETMAAYQVDKPILHTEGSLLCPEYNPVDCDPPNEDFYDKQADYAVRMYVRNWANGVSGTIWYQFEGPGWRHGGLLDENQNPKPVYDALSFLTTRLSNSEFVGKLVQYEPMEGYEFLSPDTRIWVLWSPDEIDTQIQLPENIISVLNKFGEDIYPGGGEIIVNAPIYIVLSPE